jgi:CheY-like chemotaxis protein
MSEIVGARVLVVDEDPVSRQLSAQFLRMAGFEPTLASTGAEALVTLRARPARTDWLVAPVELCGLIDGYILADEFHAAHPGRPVLLTGGEQFAGAATSEIVRLRHPARPDEVVAGLDGCGARGSVAACAPAPLPLVAAVPRVPPAPVRAHSRERLTRAAG